MVHSAEVDWGPYEIYDPGVDGPLGALSRSEARRAFEKLMAERGQRVDLLIDLAARNGVVTDTEGRGLDELCAWFSTAIEEDPQAPGRLRGRWYSVVNDIGVYLGELAIRRSDGRLRWEFFTWGRKDVAYQRHVLMGFNVPHPHYNVDFDLAVAAYAHRLLRGRAPEADLFTRMVQAAVEKAV